MIAEAVAVSYVAMQVMTNTMPVGRAPQRFISVIEPRAGKRIFAQDSVEVMTLSFDEVSPCMWSTRNEYDSVVKDFSRRGTNFTVFDEKHADSIIDFVLRAQSCERAETLYVNCAAGVARSGAIVRFIADVLSLDEASFRELNSHIEPNQHVFCMLHKRWTERGLPADVGWTNRSSAHDPVAHCQCGHVYSPTDH